MLTSRAYSLRQKSRLAISLSWIAGYTNVVTLVALGMMSSHVTGNITHLGQSLSEKLDPFASHPGGSGGSAAFLGMVLACFFVGAVLSGAMTEWAQRRRWRSQFILPISVQATLLGAFAIALATTRGGAISTSMVWILSSLASLAMGLQNATITRISGAVVRTTHLTGVVTDLGLEGVQYVLGFRDRLRRGGHRRLRRLLRSTLRDPAAERLALLATILGSFLFGVVAGTLLMLHAPAFSLAPPVAFLCFIVAIDFFQPIADVKRLDPLSDPELRGHGIDRSMLPAELALFRIAPRQAGQRHASPPFSTWADDHLHGPRVVVLSLSPHTRLDEESATDLRHAAESLRTRGRRLVLANVSREQFRVLQANGITAVVPVEDLCPDLEFAVARGVELCRPASDPPHDRASRRDR